MKIDLNWTESMQFNVNSDGHQISVDAKKPIGHDTAMTPKELVGVGLGGCTAMDVIALFKKHKQTPESFNVSVEIEKSASSYPSVFTKAIITYQATGAVDKNIFIEAVTLSQTKYCGVSAMLSKAFPIYFKILLNNELIHEGQAQFN